MANEMRFVLAAVLFIISMFRDIVLMLVEQEVDDAIVGAQTWAQLLKQGGDE